MDSEHLTRTKQRLSSLARDASSTTHEFARDNAKELLDEILDAERIVGCGIKKIALIGQVGNGKTTLLTMLGALHTGDAPTSKAQARRRGILPTGSDRTTACEVRVHHDASIDGIRIEIDGLSVDEMEYEIDNFAEDYWGSHHDQKDLAFDPHEPPPSEERLRQIRGLTKLAKNVDDPDNDPLTLVMRRFSSRYDFASTLIKRALLEERTKTTWTYGSTVEQLEACRDLLRRLNDGQQEDAALPKRLTIASGLKGSLLGSLEWIDTLGLDGSAADGRVDLQQLKQNESTLLVLCSGFKGAPDEGVRNPLTHLKPDLDRTVVLVLDHGFAAEVNDANDDRERGKRIKLNECCNRLSIDGFRPIVDHHQVLIHDALADDNQTLLSEIQTIIDTISSRRLNILHERVRDGDTFLEQYEKDPKSFPQIQIDLTLRETFDAHSLQIHTHPIHQIIADRINSERYAVRVFAMVRRAGRHQGMDLFELIRSPSGKTFKSFCKPTVLAITGALTTAEYKNSDPRIVSHIAQRRRRVESEVIRQENGFADEARACVARSLPNNRAPGNIWDQCANEWGKGPGFKQRVIGRLTDWFKANANVQREIDLLAVQHLKKVRLP